MRLSRRTLLAGTGALCAVSPTSRAQAVHPLEGQTIDLVITAAGSPASRIAAEMAPDFAAFASARHRYNVDIRFDLLPTSTAYETVSAALKSQSKVATLLVIDSQWLDAFAAPKWILPLNPLLQKKPELDVEWYAASIRPAFQLYPEAVNNRWAIPQSADVLGLYIRRDLLNAPGEADAFQRKYGTILPKTWEDFEQLAWDDFAHVLEFFTRPADGYYGIGAHWSDADPSLTSIATSFIYGRGGEIWQSKGGQVEGVLNTDANAASLAAYRALRQFQPQDSPPVDDLTAAFTQGKLFSALQWTSAGAAMIPAAMRDNVLVVPPPAFNVDGQHHRRYVIGGQSWAINAAIDDAHRLVASDFLTWWLSPETVLDFARRGGNPCDKTTLSRDDFDAIQPWFRTYRAMLPGAGQLWRDPGFKDLLAVQQQAILAVMSGTADPKLALDNAACRQQSLLFREGTAERQPGPACQDIEPSR